MPNYFAIAGFVLLAGLGLLLVAGIFRLARAAGGAAQYIEKLFSISKEIDLQKQETPRSLSSLTSIALPEILRDFPEYNFELVKLQIENDARTYLSGIQAGKSLFTEKGSAKSFREAQERETAKKAGTVAGGIVVHEIAIHSYSGEARGKVLEYQVAAEYMDAGHRRIQKRLELRYVASLEDDVEEGITTLRCQSCGAPISNVGEKVCKYCGAGQDISTRLCWVLIDIEEN